jgi:hypothetical protein
MANKSNQDSQGKKAKKTENASKRDGETMSKGAGKTAYFFGALKKLSILPAISGGQAMALESDWNAAGPGSQDRDRFYY